MIKEVFEQAIFDLEAVALKEQADQLRLNRQLQADHMLKIPVMGGMKAGKSTMLAKLLDAEQHYFPEGVLEATAKSIYVNYSFAAIRKIAYGSEDEQLVASNEEWDQLVRGKKNVEKNASLVIGLPLPFLHENNLLFVDTPGNNTVDQQKVSETWSALVDSQAGIYCLKANAVIEATDIQFIREAEYYLKDFIFVITRIDEIGAKSADASVVKQLICTVKNRLRELNVHPLDVCAVSAKNTDSLQDGIKQLSELISNIIKKNECDLKLKYAIRDSLRYLTREHASIENELMLLKKAMEVSEDTFTANTADFESRLIELESDKKQSLTRLNLQINSLQNATFKTINELSNLTITRLQRRLEIINYGKELREQGQGIYRSEVDKWRTDVIALIINIPEKSTDVIDLASVNFIDAVKSKLHDSLGIELNVCLPEEEPPCDPKYLLSELEAIEKDKTETLRNMQALQQELENESSVLPELKANMQALKDTLDKIQYEPLMEEVKYGTQSVYKELFKSMGFGIDLALTLTPIPLGKLKWLSKIKYGDKILKAIKGVNKVITTKNKILGKTKKNIPFLDKFDFLSVEHWAEKLGEHFDASNVETRLVENQDVKNEYLETVKPYQNQLIELNAKLITGECLVERHKQNIADLAKQGEELSAEYKAMQQELDAARLNLAKERDIKSLIDGKKQIIAQAYAMLMDNNAGLNAQIRADLLVRFQKLRTTSAESLRGKMELSILNIKEQLLSIKQQYSSTATEKSAKICHLESQKNCIDNVITTFGKVK